MEAYYHAIVELAKKYLDVTDVKIFVLKKTFCSVRFQLGESIFADVYYSSASGKKDLFLIANGKRVFGYDNLGGWHRHPVERPDSHEPCEEPSEETVFKEIKEVMEHFNKNPL